MRILSKVMAVAAILMTATVAGVFAVKTPAQATKCISGTSYKQFTGTIISRDTVSVKTKTGVLCSDVVLNVTAFTITNPAYNGAGWKNNPTAYPQQKYATKKVTMKKGTNGAVTVTVPVPNECTNYQLDAYIGPEQTVIDTSEGLKGTNAIVGKIFNKTKTDCSEPKPVQVKTCDTKTGAIVLVEKGKENTAPYSTDLSKCEKVEVCDTTTGKTVTVTKNEATDKKYASVDSEKCQPVEEQPKPATPAPAQELPTTGPAETALSVLGAGTLAGAATMYARSRRA